MGAQRREPVSESFEVDLFARRPYCPAMDRHRFLLTSLAFVDNILKGATPGDLSIERPTRFELC